MDIALKVTTQCGVHHKECCRLHFVICAFLDIVLHIFIECGHLDCCIWLVVLVTVMRLLVDDLRQ